MEVERRLKSDFRFDMHKKTLIVPEIFSPYPHVNSGMSTMQGSGINTGFWKNMSYQVGDDPARVDMNRAAFFSEVGISKNELAIPLQSHSENVCNVEMPGEYENCDGLVTNTQGVALAVTIADCVPILLFDPVKNVIGAVHAGWRGTANTIVQKAVRTMQVEYNTDMNDVRVFIGPSAGLCCYEVSEEVAVKFENKIVSYNNTKVFIDLKKENALQLQKQGLVKGNIEISKHCTICEKQLFHSFRRDGKRAGRMMAVVCLKP
jgi:polyphenol oxidase